jgi:hypothetical protein
VLQAVWNKIRSVVNVLNTKQNQIPGGTAGRLRTSSGTAGTLNELSSTVGSTQVPVYILNGVPTQATAVMDTLDEQTVYGIKRFNSSPRVIISGTDRVVYAGNVSGSTLYLYSN